LFILIETRLSSLESTLKHVDRKGRTLLFFIIVTSGNPSSAR